MLPAPSGSGLAGGTGYNPGPLPRVRDTEWSQASILGVMSPSSFTAQVVTSGHFAFKDRRLFCSTFAPLKCWGVKHPDNTRWLNSICSLAGAGGPLGPAPGLCPEDGWCVQSPPQTEDTRGRQAQVCPEQGRKKWFPVSRGATPRVPEVCFLLTLATGPFTGGLHAVPAWGSLLGFLLEGVR